MTLTTLYDFVAAPDALKFLCEINSDDALYRRDDNVAFEACWQQHFDGLKAYPFTERDMANINMLREQAFKRAFELTSNDDLAAAVSDDIDMIARSLLADRHDQWPITYLWRSYCDAIFPGQAC